MKRSFFLAMCIFLFHAAKANTYYFSSSTGSDDRSAKQAQNSSTPWKSLDKLNSFFSNLDAGDAVLLKRGDIFYGSITVSKSGSSGSPIIIGAYGSGDKPVITSLVTLTGWSADNAHRGVYQSAANQSLSSTVNTVLINGAPQELGRYPNSDAANKGYLSFQAHEGTTSITDNNLSSNVNWTGAELVLRQRRWVIDRDLITSQSGSTIFYSPSSKYEPDNKSGYFIQNDIKTLDKPGEWYYNPSSKQLSVFVGKNNPSSYTIQASSIDNLISSSNYSNVTFDNLQIEGSNVCGFIIKNGSNINIKNCDILFSGRDGLRVSNHKNLDIENCTVANSNNNGIDISGSNNVTLRNNSIINTSILPGMTGSGDGKGLALHCYGNGSIIEYNEIRNSGYSALDFNGDDVTIKNNFIDSFCIIKDDGGGIYSYTGYSKSARKGRVVIGNILINGVGAPQGTGYPNREANGIYMDVGSTGVEIMDNTVANTASGIFFHNAHDLTVKNNTCFNNKVGLYMQRNGNKIFIRNNIITNNIFFSKSPKQLAVSISTSGDDIDSIGSLDSNYYSRPLADDLVFKQSVAGNGGKNVTKLLTLDDWKNTYRYDPASRKSPVQYNNNANPDDYIRFEYNPSANNKTVNLGGTYRDVNNNVYSNSVVIKPFSSVILLKQPGKRFG